ncbi:uncharacterized protein MELLADRAFT_56604 [Melampsora larici-populina 98AG31]|uniref:Uncharacterized protein n=1 Tax=Melampsora larici-populina (strain 98AG31 / pathotype 3-4-7) TaxID=747676 RepID=F4RSD9_MELLP|nr:uncharacterized protein MELLADRAFT_56604 [Melampsora larici-populina 98AG31]EGG04580.1 hypothetical protein MELLADRAFT_56604 [Melampsora larici-populina 98AG31]
MDGIPGARILIVRIRESGRPVHKRPTSLMKWVESCDRGGFTRNRNRSKGCKDQSTQISKKVVLLKLKFKNDLHPLACMTG